MALDNLLKQFDLLREFCIIIWASLMVQLVNSPPASAGDTRDMSLIPGSGRSPGEENVLITYYNS